MVILVSFLFMVKASLKLVVYTCICGYTVEGNVEYLIWIGTFRGVNSPHVQQQAPLSVSPH